MYRFFIKTILFIIAFVAIIFIPIFVGDMIGLKRAIYPLKWAVGVLFILPTTGIVYGLNRLLNCAVDSSAQKKRKKVVENGHK